MVRLLSNKLMTFLLILLKRKIFFHFYSNFQKQFLKLNNKPCENTLQISLGKKVYLLNKNKKFFYFTKNNTIEKFFKIAFFNV